MDLAYLAGFFDGEGCVSLGQDYALVISAGQVVEEPLLMLQSAFGGTVRKVRSKHPSHQDMHHWTLSRGRASEALECMVPFLHVKRDQAIIGMSFQRLFSENPKRRLTNDQRDLRQVMIDTVRYIKHNA